MPNSLQYSLFDPPKPRPIAPVAPTVQLQLALPGGSPALSVAPATPRVQTPAGLNLTAPPQNPALFSAPAAPVAPAGPPVTVQPAPRAPTFGNASSLANPVPRAPLVPPNPLSNSSPANFAARQTAAEAYLAGQTGAAGLPPRAPPVAPGIPGGPVPKPGLLRSAANLGVGTVKVGSVLAALSGVNSYNAREVPADADFIDRAAAQGDRIAGGAIRGLASFGDSMAGIVGFQPGLTQRADARAAELGMSLKPDIQKQIRLASFLDQNPSASDDDLRAVAAGGGEENRKPSSVPPLPFVGARTPWLRPEDAYRAGAASVERQPTVAPPSPVGGLTDSPITVSDSRAALLRTLGAVDPGEYANLGNYGGGTTIYGTALRKGGRIDTFSDSPTGAAGGAGGSRAAAVSPLAGAFQSALAEMNKRGSGDGAIVNREGMFRDPTGGSRQQSINARFDERERELRQIFSSPEARGNLAKHLVDLEKLRGDELGLDQRGLLELRGQDIGAGTAYREQDMGQQKSRLATLASLLENETSNNISRQNNLRDNIVRALVAEMADDRADARLEASDKRALERELLANARLARGDTKTQLENEVRGDTINASSAKIASGGDTNRENANLYTLSTMPEEFHDYMKSASPQDQRRGAADALKWADFVNDHDVSGGRSKEAMLTNGVIGGIAGGSGLGIKPLAYLGKGLDFAIGRYLPSTRNAHFAEKMLGNRAVAAAVGAGIAGYGLTRPTAPITRGSAPKVNFDESGRPYIERATPTLPEAWNRGMGSTLWNYLDNDFARTTNNDLYTGVDDIAEQNPGALTAGLEIDKAMRIARERRRLEDLAR